MLYLIDYNILVKVEPSMQTDYSFKKTIFFLYSPKNDQEGDQKLKINFALPKVYFTAINRSAIVQVRSKFEAKSKGFTGFLSGNASRGGGQN